MLVDFGDDEPPQPARLPIIPATSSIDNSLVCFRRFGTIRSSPAIVRVPEVVNSIREPNAAVDVVVPGAVEVSVIEPVAPGATCAVLQLRPTGRVAAAHRNRSVVAKYALARDSNGGRLSPRLPSADSESLLR